MSPSKKPTPPALRPADVRFILASLAVLAVFVIVMFAGLAWASSGQSTPIAAVPTFKDTQAANDPLMTVVPQLNDMLAAPLANSADPAVGPDDAAVTLTVFSDMTCHYCGETVRAALAVQQNHPQRVRVVHKDFPEPNKAYASYQAAIAARCAQRQGLFWEFADKLYEHYDQISPERITELARDLPHLDQALFKECRNGRTSQPVTAHIDDNIAEATALELSGVPVVYVNDKALFGQVSAEELEAAVTALDHF